MFFTLDQVRAHSKADDIWIVLHNKVYDITKYLEDHPGGDAILREVAGTDATEAFEEVGHSGEAREQLEPFYIGDLPTEEQTESVKVYRPTFEQVSQSAAINVKPQRRTSVLYSALKLGLSGLAGTVAITTYRHGIAIPQINLLPGLSSPSLPFWSGACIASTLQLSLTLGLGLWISTKLDVQQEFTHYTARRPTKPAQLLHHTPAPTLPILDPRKWRPFTLTHKQQVAPNVYIFKFALPTPTSTLNLPTGQHIALRATITGAPVSRSYTPISNNKDRGHISLLVKIYPAGLMTTHLANMTPGETIDIRGPKGAMTYSRTYASHIGMLAGGTGITPMYQLIRAICEDPEDKTQISLLYANNSESDILLRNELDAFARRCPEKFKVRYVLSRPSEGWAGYTGFVSESMVREEIEPVGEGRRVLLCGPPGMVGALKGVLGGLGWEMPGVVAKAGDRVFLF